VLEPKTLVTTARLVAAVTKYGVKYMTPRNEVIIFANKEANNAIITLNW